jgi:hypothetical protein
MAVMGFSHDPGPLPFVTLRDAGKWPNRLVGVPPFVEMRGEHGCNMPYQVAKLVSIEPYEGPLPSHLASVYVGRKLVAIALAKATVEELTAAGIPVPVNHG